MKIRAIVLVLVLVLDSFGGQPDPSKWAGCIAYYTANGTARDSSFSAAHGSLADNANAVSNGVRLAAFGLDGSGDYINCGAGSAFATMTHGLSAAAWIKYSATNSSGSDQIVGRRNSAVLTNAWSLFVTTSHFPGFIIYTAPNTIGANLTDNQAVLIGQWYHVAGTYDGTTARLYVNGILRTNAAVTPPIYVDPVIVTVGIRSDLNATTALNGIIDEVGLFNRGLSEAEVNQLYTVTHPNSLTQ